MGVTVNPNTLYPCSAAIPRSRSIRAVLVEEHPALPSRNTRRYSLSARPVDVSSRAARLHFAGHLGCEQEFGSGEPDLHDFAGLRAHASTRFGAENVAPVLQGALVQRP